MKIYYAHPITIYDTPQEGRDESTICKLFNVTSVNPNSAENEAAYKERGMEFFEEMVKSCDALCFRAFPDGSIPAGVAKEIGWANEIGIPVIELPTAVWKRTRRRLSGPSRNALSPSRG